MLAKEHAETVLGFLEAADREFELGEDWEWEADRPLVRRFLERVLDTRHGLVPFLYIPAGKGHLLTIWAVYDAMTVNL